MERVREIFSSDKYNRIIVFAALLLGFLVLGLPLTVTYITDETGTMANAAFLAGIQAEIRIVTRLTAAAPVRAEWTGLCLLIKQGGTITNTARRCSGILFLPW